MTIVEYLDSVKARLLTDPVVSGFHVIRERATLTDGHLRARLTLADGGLLEFSEYVQRSPDGAINVITYSYHWADVHGNLIRRWDKHTTLPRPARLSIPHPRWAYRYSQPWSAGQYICRD